MTADMGVATAWPASCVCGVCGVCIASACGVPVLRDDNARMFGGGELRWRMRILDLRVGMRAAFFLCGEGVACVCGTIGITVLGTRVLHARGGRRLKKSVWAECEQCTECSR